MKGEDKSRYGDRLFMVELIHDLFRKHLGVDLCWTQCIECAIRELKPEDIVHLHSLLGQKKKLEVIQTIVDNYPDHADYPRLIVEVRPMNRNDVFKIMDSLNYVLINHDPIGDNYLFQINSMIENV